jgi:hypothetical protein
MENILPIKKNKIAIIGGGTTGLCLATFLMKNGLNTNCEIDIYDKNPGGRLRTISYAEHCDRIFTSQYINFINVLDTFNIRYDKVKIKSDIASFSKFNLRSLIELVFYTKNITFGILKDAILSFFSSMYSCNGFSSDLISNPIISELKKHKFNFIEKNVLSIEKVNDDKGVFLINSEKNYDYIFCTVRHNNLLKINVKNISNNIQQLNNYIDADMFNVPYKYDIILNDSYDFIDFSLYCYMNFEYSMLVKPGIKTIMLSCLKPVDLTQKSIDLTHSIINYIKPLLSNINVNHIQSINIHHFINIIRFFSNIFIHNMIIFIINF